MQAFDHIESEELDTLDINPLYTSLTEYTLRDSTPPKSM